MKTLLVSLCFLIFSILQSHGQTTAQQLTAGVWPIVALGLDYNGDGTVNRDFTKPCHAGATMTFLPDGTGVFYQGPAPCDAAKPANQPFTWTLTNSTNLTMVLNGKTENVVIHALGAKELVIRFKSSKTLFKMQKP